MMRVLAENIVEAYDHRLHARVASFDFLCPHCGTQHAASTPVTSWGGFRRADIVMACGVIPVKGPRQEQEEL